MSGEQRFDVPDELVEAIADGRCVAFLGAGVSLPDAPDWPELLRRLAAHAPPPYGASALEILGPKDPTGAARPQAPDLEAAAQILRDGFAAIDGTDAAFESAMKQVLGTLTHAVTRERYQRLREIPFEAVLTTNQDSLLDGSCADDAYRDVLRGDARRRRRWQFEGEESDPCVIKLHGDATAPTANPVVLARSDYRRRLYRDGRYANFLRAVFATRTVLFLGVSFTDAYLNELRSEVMALLGRAPSAADEPIGYAVMGGRSAAWCEYMRRHDGIEILPYDLGPTKQDHGGFDRWIAAIHARTAPAPRVARLLQEHANVHGGEPRIVWLDRHPQNNQHRELALLEAAGVPVERVRDPASLDEETHGRAALLISAYDTGLTPPLVDRAMARMRSWATRPPVIVFTSGALFETKRPHCLRVGAFECCCRWSDLFDAIERLFRMRRGDD